MGAFVVLFALLGIGVYGMVANHDAPRMGYVRPTPQVDRTVVGTVVHPALTIVGDDVIVRTAGFSARAVVTGPLVPGEGLPFQASYTTCTWTVSLSHVVGHIPIALADFDSIDHTGTVYKMGFVPGQPTPPPVIHTGENLTFQLRAVMPVGEGLMRWAPDGNNIVAKWDYQVEND